MDSGEITKEATNVDWSAVIAGIALVVAVISPLLTSWMNNRHETKMKYLELNQTRMINAYENYLKYTAEYLVTLRGEEHIKYASAKGDICLYLPEYLRESVYRLDHEIVSRNFDNARTLFESITEDLVKYFNNVKK